MARLLLPCRCDAIGRVLILFLAGALLLLPGQLHAEGGNAPGLYRVDLEGVGSCYDADLSLMLSAYVFAYLDAGALEVSFPRPPAGIKVRERVQLLGILAADFPAQASRYLVRAVIGRNVLLAFDGVERSASGALLAYVYLPEDGTCVNLKLVRDGYARVAPVDVPFQFRSEFEMYEQQARLNHTGIWEQQLPRH